MEKPKITTQKKEKPNTAVMNKGTDSGWMEAERPRTGWKWSSNGGK